MKTDGIGGIDSVSRNASSFTPPNFWILARCVSPLVAVTHAIIERKVIEMGRKGRWEGKRIRPIIATKLVEP